MDRLDQCKIQNVLQIVYSQVIFQAYSENYAKQSIT